MFFIDGHCDTLSKVLDENKSLYENDLQFSISKVNKQGGGIQIMASFVETNFINDHNGGFIRCKNIINKIKQYEVNNNVNIVIKNKSELLQAINKKETKVILSIENGSAISGNLENVNYFYNQGVRVMSITWNDDNELGCGCRTKNDTGLTNLGIEYVKKLNDLDILVDVSHLSEKSLKDVISNTSKPIVATHSNAFEICNNNRNLKDEQIKAIAKSGGIIGVCFYTDFLNSNKKANIADIVKHIKYIKNIVGINYIGLGSDFDGMDYEKIADGIENIGKIHNIENELRKEGFCNKEIEKILWENWSFLLKKVIK